VRIDRHDIQSGDASESCRAEDSLVVCNLCQSNELRRLPYHYLWEEKRFQGMKCRRCGLIAVDPLPSDAELERLYSHDYFDTGLHGLDQAGVDYETLADRRLDSTRRFIRQVIRSRHAAATGLFEVGAAMGHFLQAAQLEGYRCGGIEFSPTAAERAREKFGLDLITGNFEELDLSGQHEQWDVVYNGDLLEHLRDPAAAVERLAGLVAPGGICVTRLPGTFNLLSTRLATPLLGALGRSMQLPDKPYHLYEFTTSTAHRLFSRHFRSVEIINEANPPGKLNLKTRSAGYVAKYIMQYVNYPLTRWTHRFGDRMTVIARNRSFR